VRKANSVAVTVRDDWRRMIGWFLFPVLICGVENTTPSPLFLSFLSLSFHELFIYLFYFSLKR